MPVIKVGQYERTAHYWELQMSPSFLTCNMPDNFIYAYGQLLCSMPKLTTITTNI